MDLVQVVLGLSKLFSFMHYFVQLICDSWIKLAYPLSQRSGYSVIFVDLPGFGQSSGRVLDQTSWKRHGPDIIVAILSSFHIRHEVSIVAQCGKY
jgi:pimeloyl-ACP methyl ester carboxylesterase